MPKSIAPRHRRLAPNPTPPSMGEILESCIGCRCTEADGCPGGCSWWIEPAAAGVGLCSACVDDRHVMAALVLTAFSNRGEFRLILNHLRKVS